VVQASEVAARCETGVDGDRFGVIEADSGLGSMPPLADAGSIQPADPSGPSAAGVTGQRIVFASRSRG
jgi:hypothetical protein